ncbi:hypothetical protein EHW66_21260 [Erwinia psidii]|uniref:hypothetical protein n=1 Tax=Erwinia psidii TaxID=69224 RepID=UPI00226BA8D0|nr:hypothetical protein [Erwinia psidii]MCX8967399.1 hypothetical protein [Erwinia psidii]
MDDKITISEASDYANQLTALLCLLYEKGGSEGLKPYDDVMGIAYNLMGKIHGYLREESKRKEKEEWPQCRA